MSQFKTDGFGEQCPKCHKPMQHRIRTKPSKLHTFYYTAFDYCPNCPHTAFYEHFKVQADGPIAFDEATKKPIYESNNTLF